MQRKYSMIQEELPEENTIFKVSLPFLSNLADKEIPLRRNQIFSTVHTLDFFINLAFFFQFYEPKDFQSQESDTQNTWK